ncbi:MAG TPA: type I-E CRISPR-associated protein Cse1/CasA [Ktedonobacterales bacterium]
MPSFNLIDEPWIPCAPPGREEPRLLSLRAALTNAHEWQEITDDSPLVVVALHRLLLAILHRVYRGPHDVAEWHAMQAHGRFDAASIGSYLDEWMPSFDLFDAERPFYQVTEIEKTKANSVAILAHELASGNNLTLFDHSTGASTAFTPAQAARYLIAFQAFAMGGGKSEPFYLKDAPLAGDYMVLVRGDSLFETLLLNLMQYDKERPIRWLYKDDPPWWERETHAVPDEGGTPPAGYLDYLTWQSRRVHLYYDEATGRVSNCQVRQNLALGGDMLDPFESYRRSEERGWNPLRFSEGKATWRDSHALLEQASNIMEGTTKRPEIFEWLARTTTTSDGRPFGEKRRYSFDVLGYLKSPKQALVILWRQDRLPLPLEYLTQRSLRDVLNAGIQLAEAVGTLFLGGFAKEGKNSFPRPLQVLGQELVAPSPGYEPDGRRMKGRGADSKALGNLIDHLEIQRSYWAALELHFHRFMVDLAEQWENTGDDGEVAALAEWARAVDRSAQRAFAVATASLDTNARVMQATALAEQAFSRQLSQRLDVGLAPYGLTTDTVRKGQS